MIPSRTRGIFAILFIVAACDSSEPSATAPRSDASAGGSGGTGGLGTGGSPTTGGSPATGGASGATDAGAGGNAGAAGADARADSGVACPAPDGGPCDFSAAKALPCDSPLCCGATVACVRSACVDRCGQPASQVGSILAPNVALVGQICGAGQVTAVVVESGTCATPVGYDLVAPYDASTGTFTFSVERRILTPKDAHPVAEKVVQGVTFALKPPAQKAQYVPATFSVNPGETRVAFGQSVGATAAGTLFVLDLKTGALRSVDAVFPAHTAWVDDDHFLAYAAPLGATAPDGKGGLYYVDATSPTLASTFVAGTFQGGGPLGVLPGGSALSGGVPYQGGVTPALVAIPLTEIQKVVAGTRATIDVFADAAVQRFARETYKLQGWVRGLWFVSPTDPNYLTWQIEPLTVSQGTLSFGAASPLIAGTGSQPIFDVFDTGGAALFVTYGNDSMVVEAP